MLYATGQQEETILKMVDATNNDDADMWASVFAKDANCYMKHQVFNPAEAVQSPAEAGQFFGVTDPDVWMFPSSAFKQRLLDRDDVVGFEYTIYRKGGTITRGYMQLNFDADAKITSAVVDIPK